jgi:hypothetical protein
MVYFPPKHRSDVINLLQNARWRFSQIAGHADGQAEPKLIKAWSDDGFDAVQKVLEWLDTQARQKVLDELRICPHCNKAGF